MPFPFQRYSLLYYCFTYRVNVAIFFSNIKVCYIYRKIVDIGGSRSDINYSIKSEYNKTLSFVHPCLIQEQLVSFQVSLGGKMSSKSAILWLALFSIVCCFGVGWCRFIITLTMLHTRFILFHIHNNDKIK